MAGQPVVCIRPFDRLELGFEIPVIFYQVTDNIFLAESLNAEEDPGLGDIRLVPKLLLYDGVGEDGSGIVLGLSSDVFLPTGDPVLYQGEDLRVYPRLALSYSVDSNLQFGVNAGYMARSGFNTHDLEKDDVLTYGLATSIGASEEITIIVEVDGAVAVTADDINISEAPLEGRAAGRYAINENITAHLGFGVGLVGGFGSPDFRILGGISYTNHPESDRDGDGYVDSEDGCPDEPEDFDDFQDADGCPDPDNDSDLILDVDDDCPMDPEDYDEFEDENGCPDPDNDQDTILDVDDECPMDPEDFDTFEDENGCPDPDNDQDLILDVDDECPMEPETYNEYLDEDGCPDEVPIVLVQCVAVELGERVYFDTDSDVIQSRSFALLGALTSTLVENPDLTLIRVDGHTDSNGTDAHNLDLSRRRAASVVTYLIENGVAASRLTSEGFGESTPIDTNETEAGRQNNRRVELQILEQEGCD